jgi:Glycosyl hydrolases family 43
LFGFRSLIRTFSCTAVAATLLACNVDDAADLRTDAAVSSGGDGGVTALPTGGTTSGGAAPAGSGGFLVGTGGTGASSSGSGGNPGAGGANGTGGLLGAGGAGTGGAGTGGSATGGSATGGSGNCTPPAAGSHGQNPLFSDQYTADPAPFVDGCTFYVHCGHDEGTTGFVMREWFALSSTDMVHWTKEVALRLSDFPWANANAWAGQVVTANGKYYWYVPVNQTGGGMAIGVAVADGPRGPFKDALGKALVDDAFEMSNMNFARPSDTVYTIDPTVFVDDDGQAYLHYGGFGRLVVTKLGSDMTSISGTMRESTPRGFFEAPFLFKRNGKYYEVYAAGVNPASIDYATSSSPLGPWTYGGRILDPLPNVSGQDPATSHSGVAEFAGQWYLVYHLSNGPNGGGTYRREVGVDKLFFNADGSIQKIVPSSGLGF